jgi:hypothetical protein
MQRILSFLAIYNMFENKRNMVIKIKNYQEGNSFEAHSISTIENGVQDKKNLI